MPWLPVAPSGTQAHVVSSGADKEVEVGACVGLLYVVYVEPLPPAGGIGKACEGGGVGSAPLSLSGLEPVAPALSERSRR
jgi:hypothetical protein